MRLTARSYTIDAAAIAANPARDTLHALTAEMSNARCTVFGTLSVQACVGGGATAGAFIVSDNPRITPAARGSAPAPAS